MGEGGRDQELITSAAIAETQGMFDRLHNRTTAGAAGLLTRLLIYKREQSETDNASYVAHGT